MCSGRTFVSMIFDTNQFDTETGSMGDCLIAFTEDGEIQFNPALLNSNEDATNCMAFVVHDDDNDHWSYFNDDEFEAVQDARACGYFFNSYWCKDDTFILTCTLTNRGIRKVWDHYNAIVNGAGKAPQWLICLITQMPSLGLKE